MSEPKELTEEGMKASLMYADVLESMGATKEAELIRCWAATVVARNATIAELIKARDTEREDAHFHISTLVDGINVHEERIKELDAEIAKMNDLFEIEYGEAAGALDDIFKLRKALRRMCQRYQINRAEIADLKARLDKTNRDLRGLRPAITDPGLAGMFDLMIKRLAQPAKLEEE